MKKTAILAVICAILPMFVSAQTASNNNAKEKKHARSK